MDGTPAARVCCLDLDTFFVSVERLLDPSLVGKPVIVGAAPGQRGVVTAASYEVRAFGVHSGMSATEARRLAPHAVFVPTRFGTYGPYAERVKAVLERFSPSVKPASIDEFFLDFRGCERMYAQPLDADGDATIERTIRAMRQAIQDEVGLPASAGVGATRAIAKIASNFAKPAGVRMVRVGEEEAFVWPLPVRKYPGIGPVAERRLLEGGVETLGALLSLPPGPNRAKFGALAASVRRGIDGARASKALPHRPSFREHDEGGAVGSISNERTFRADVGDWGRVQDQVRALCERVCWRARRRGIRARTVTLKLRYADFHTISRGHTRSPTHDEAAVYKTALELLGAAWVRPLPIRLVGIQLSNLVGLTQQLGLPFHEHRRPAVGAALDAIRERFGYDAVRLGATERKSWLA